ncbi:hypothetical protein CI610_02323 [invertebrate metagenome]|uniref:Phage T7 F exclusion suppressor FxsA n=1 Tax=invertebrate metagenome TaxID=1711999 RepID=A0A2H9T698_9ZZZZ
MGLPFWLLVFPFIELFVLIKVGSAIGAFNTIALIILGSVVGLGIIRRQGFRTMLNARAQMNQGMLPGTEMLSGFLIAMGGFLIMLPGFITDIMGLVLLVSPVQQWVIRRMLASGRWQAQHHVYEGEFYREDKEDVYSLSINHTTHSDRNDDNKQH